MQHVKTFYKLDSKDRIMSVGGSWDTFAQENGGCYIASDELAGRLIWDFVTDDVTRMWLHTIFDSVRVLGRAVERPSRCDSPSVKRHMRMRIRPTNDRLLLVEHQLLSIEKRTSPLIVRTVGENRDCSDFRVRCSFCGRVKSNTAWEEPDDRHASKSGDILVAYSVCGPCAQLCNSCSMSDWTEGRQ